MNLFYFFQRSWQLDCLIVPNNTKRHASPTIVSLELGLTKFAKLLEKQKENLSILPQVYCLLIMLHNHMATWNYTNEYDFQQHMAANLYQTNLNKMHHQKWFLQSFGYPDLRIWRKNCKGNVSILLWVYCLLIMLHNHMATWNYYFLSERNLRSGCQTKLNNMHHQNAFFKMGGSRSRHGLINSLKYHIRIV